jgi:hypothetical protein
MPDSDYDALNEDEEDGDDALWLNGVGDQNGATGGGGDNAGGGGSAGDDERLC